ncbi:MAG: sugar transferase [Xanthomonadales bacterium]|jgi:exopolysaccharide biosynthesis polyprenyl glycosylphosphotransferase|nr:sugar transferase [Xanthomonadales bacterium]
MLNRGTSKQRTLILGSGSMARELLAEIRRRPRCPIDVVGVLAEPAYRGDKLGGYPVLGKLNSLVRVLKEHGPQLIIVAHAPGTVDLSEHQLLEASVHGSFQIAQASTVYEQLSGKLPLESYDLEDVLYSETFQPARSSLVATRLLSLAAAVVGLVLTAPLMLLIALLIRLDSPGPALFRQERSGYLGRPFMLVKFRTMRHAEEHRSEWEGDNADRITGVGRWLRKFRLDELPQFFNVLKGDMNLVGPRPHPASNIALLSLVARNTAESGVPIPYYDLRSTVRPGITGWAQVRYRYANNLQEEIEKLHFDLYYIKHYSLALDLQILLETVWVVFAGHTVASDPAEEIDSPSATGVGDRRQTTTP